jgi:hypothetical protein
MKAYEIPVSRAVLKMLKRDYGYVGHMRIDKMMSCKVQGHHSSWHKYLNSLHPHQTRITVICPYASTKRLYTICRLMEYEFKTKLLLYVEGAAENKKEVSEAIRRFMDKYDLTMEDLEMETALKWWRRYLTKEQIKNLIPLW